MFGIAARLLGGAVSPLVDQLAAFGASVLRKLALFLLAAVCMIVCVIALTIAFDLWVASLAGPIIGALAVAGLYFVIGIAAVVLALRGGQQKPKPAVADEATSDKSEKVDQFTAPILALLQSLGLRREQFAVLAGANLAKRLGPVPLVGVAIVAGFLVGRLWQGWDALLSSEAVDSVLNLIVPGRRQQDAASKHDAEADSAT